MSAEPDRNPLAPGIEGEPSVQDQLEALDGDLMRRIPADSRLESGVPEGQLSGALDFIQMTGLTRPPARKTGSGPVTNILDDPARPDIDTSAPLSFYEKGVADVDESMGDGDFDTGIRDAALDANLVADEGTDRLAPPESNAAKAFSDIIAALESNVGITSEEGTQSYEALEPVQSDDTVAALRSLADDLAAPMKRPVAPDAAEEGTADSIAMEVTLPEETIGREHGGDAEETPLATTTAPAAEANTAPSIEAGLTESTDDFDELLASLDTGTSAETPASDISEATSKESETNDLSEDWDALLDNVARAGKDVAHTPAPSPPGRGSLAKAEELMHVLSAQPGHPEKGRAASDYSDGQGEQDIEPVPTYDYSAVPSRRRSRRHSRLARRGWRLVKVALLLCITAGAGVYLWLNILAPLVEKPEDLEANAAQLMDSGRYAEASVAFLQLARRPSADRADAQFRAAYALTLDHRDRAVDQIHARYKSALEIFENFIKENPQHPKSTRALCLMGRLHYELGNYDTAIEILRDQIKPVDDPAAAMAMLRYLARSYMMTGAYEEAETSYLQAATLPGNYSAETDYLELGEMFRTRAGLSEDPAARAKLEDTAVAYWNRGVQVPGISPGRLDALQERLKWSAFTEDANRTPSDASENEPAASPMPAIEVAPETTPPSPVPNGTDSQVPDPGVEIEAMIPQSAAANAIVAPVTETAAE